MSSSNIEEITFGVEIETTVPFAAGIQVGGYHNGTHVIGAPAFNGAGWKAEADGSIRVGKNGHRPCEFVSPILRGEAGLQNLVAMVEWLRSIGAAVNPSCGFHVHLGVSGIAGGEEVTAYLDRLARLAAFNAKALYAQTGTVGRERGAYCRPPDARYQQAVKAAKKAKNATAAVRGTSRYTLLNLTPVGSQGTVEFRCFGATLNTSKALLHVFSSIAVAVIARKAKTPASWKNEALSGTKALTNFLKVRPMQRIVSAPTFGSHWQRMIAKALEMAAKYDSAQAIADLVDLTAATPRARRA